MRLVEREEFLSLPAGTVFVEYEEHFFGPLTIKGETIADMDEYSAGDYFEQVPSQCVDGYPLEGLSLKYDPEFSGRNGCYERDQKYLVWERAEVETLIHELRGAQ